MIKDLEKIASQQERMKELISRLNGNFIEIGAGVGIMTKLMLERAKQINKLVYVIDPFNYIKGTDKSYFEPYKLQDFLDNIDEFKDYLVLIKKASQDESVYEELKEIKDIAMIYVDGLQTKEAVLSDLYLSDKLNPKIIVVDDINRLNGSSQVPLAIQDFQTKKKFYNNKQKEGYFI